MKQIFLSVAVAALFLTSCGKDDDPITETPTEENLSGDLSTERTLNANTTYTLTGSLKVKNGGKLRIPAGTVIKAEKGFDKYILVEQGGQIFVNGTAEKPVKMTSAAATPAPGDWGGLVINGKAKISGAAGQTPTGTTEIDPTVPYGGGDDADNSGVIEYLTLEFTGSKSSADIEHNGLTLNGVGSGTKIENVYIPYSADDGVEFFGGAVNVKNILVVNSDDDMFDATQGWRGTLDNAYGVWQVNTIDPTGKSVPFTSNEADPRGAELDGNLDGNTPADINQSNFKFQNITIVNKSAFPMQDAVKVRRGATAAITNLLVKGTTCTDLIDLTDGKGTGNIATNISFKKDITVSGTEINLGTAIGATVTANAANTGASSSSFGWTGFSDF
ncbi:hypothetical protein [Niabella ginsengisoli]|uniref:Multidrug transporter n=1 Tax=Niabella ginsengisoli TaxID=522298 RepID=A0ABS9SPB4_9BACT|nr:hypothetical protein [Niabella ginsengisoli]MCH5600248.1 hypothetical protein [Niabella ginsengisoli]